MAYTKEQINDIVEKYESQSPTPETSTEIVRSIAEELDISPNGVRMILVNAGVYVKNGATSGGTSKPAGKTAAKTGETKRVSKEEQHNALKQAIEERGAEVDEEIVSKLTGKAAAYFTEVLRK